MLKIQNGKILFVLVLGIVLTACGGGGGSGSGGGGGGGTTGTSSGGPDIAVTGFTGVPTATINTSYQVSFTVVNNGSATAGFVPRVDLSPNSNLYIDAFFIGMESSLVLLDPGQSTVINMTVKIPNGLGSGTYYMGPVLTVVGDVNQANNTMSAPVAIAGLTCSDDAYEADDSAASAKTLLLGNPQSHNHCNASSDWMQFNAVGGTAYGFNTTELGQDAWATLLVYDSDGSTLLATSQASSNSVNEQRLTWIAPRSGAFYLRAAPAVPLSTVGPNTSYVVGLGDMRPDLVPRHQYSNAQVYAGGTVDTSVEVHNIGFATAGASKLTWYLSSDPVITSADLPLLVVDVPTLDAEKAFIQYSTRVPVPGSVTPGNWYIGVLVNSDSSVNEYSQVNNATVGAAIQVLALTACSPDAYEDNDTISAATLLTSGAAAQQHNLCDDGIDWFKFNAVAGNSYHVTSGQSYSVVAPDTTTTLTLDANGNFTTTQTATYYVRVLSGYYPNQGASDYTMKLDPALPDLAFYSLLNPQTTSVYAGGWIDVGMTLQNIGFIPSPDYELSMHRSTSATLDASAPLVASTTMSFLVNGSFDTMATTYMRIYFDKNMAPGTYYLRGALDRTNAIAEVREDNNLSNLTTTATKITVSAPPCTIDAYEDNDSAAAATTILEGSPQTHNHCDDRVDWAKFTASANGVYLAMADRPGGGSPTMYVLESDAKTPAQTQRSEEIVKGSSVPWQASWNALAGHTYYLMVDNTNNLSYGNYTLSVKQCAIDAFENDDSYSSATPAALGVLQTRNHCEDNDDWIVLNATQGVSYTVVAANVGSASKVAVSLFDSTGNNTLTTGSPGPGGKSSEINGWVAPATGTYYIRLYQEFATGWGDNTGYTVKIN